MTATDDPWVDADPATTVDLEAPSDLRQAYDANVAETEAGVHPASCPTCGQDVPPVRVMLSDTLTRVSTRSAEMVAAFYARLFEQRADLAEMFPPDLIDATSAPESGGYVQRERLLNAAVAVASHFNPGNDESMAALNSALDRMGADHGDNRMTVADPEWPGGRRPLLQREYDVVNACLIATLREFHGEAWTPMHTAAWWIAMTYVADRMGAAQIVSSPRRSQ